MLQIHSKSLDFSGVSKVDEVAVASMHASYSENSDMYFNMSIANVALYAENKVLVDADIADFCKEVVDAILATKAEADAQ